MATHCSPTHSAAVLQGLLSQVPAGRKQAAHTYINKKILVLPVRCAFSSLQNQTLSSRVWDWVRHLQCVYTCTQCRQRKERSFSIALSVQSCSGIHNHTVFEDTQQLQITSLMCTSVLCSSGCDTCSLCFLVLKVVLLLLPTELFREWRTLMRWLRGTVTCNHASNEH